MSSPMETVPMDEDHVDQWITCFHEWDKARQEEAMNQFVLSCSHFQLRSLNAKVTPLLQRDFVSGLPHEIAIHILGFLDGPSLARASQVCRNWRQLAFDGSLWRVLCKRHNYTPETFLRIRSTKVPEPPYPRDLFHWRDVYIANRELELNWEAGRVTEKQTIAAHDTGSVITCLELYSDYIISGSDDNTVSVWDARTGELKHRLRGHTGGVWSCERAGNKIVTGATDRTLRVWDIDLGLCLHELKGHSSTVRCVHVEGNTIVSGSRDSTLRVWNMQTGACLHVLRGHQAAVRCVCLRNSLVVSASYDTTLKVWDVNTGKVNHSLEGHSKRIYSMQFDGETAVSGSLDTEIWVWDVVKGRAKFVLRGHHSLVGVLRLHGNLLVSGNADSTIKLWNIETGALVHTFQGHRAAVTCIYSDDHRIVSGSDDGTIKVWDIATGHFLHDLLSVNRSGVIWRLTFNKLQLAAAVRSSVPLNRSIDDVAPDQTQIRLFNFCSLRRKSDVE